MIGMKSKRLRVYIIRKAGSIQRIGGMDKTGILYFGKATSLKSRIYRFLDANHTASSFLWHHIPIARLVLNSNICNQGDVIVHLKKLTVRVAASLKVKQLKYAERALLFCYLKKFGEAPPLNLNIPSRWVSEPTPRDLQWAEEGIKRRM
jgi:hypothetical protein